LELAWGYKIRRNWKRVAIMTNRWDREGNGDLTRAARNIDRLVEEVGDKNKKKA